MSEYEFVKLLSFNGRTRAGRSFTPIDAIILSKKIIQEGYNIIFIRWVRKEVHAILTQEFTKHHFHLLHLPEDDPKKSKKQKTDLPGLIFASKYKILTWEFDKYHPDLTLRLKSLSGSHTGHLSVCVGLHAGLDLWVFSPVIDLRKGLASNISLEGALGDYFKNFRKVMHSKLWSLDCPLNQINGGNSHIELTYGSYLEFWFGENCAIYDKFHILGGGTINHAYRQRFKILRLNQTSPSVPVHYRDVFLLQTYQGTYPYLSDPSISGIFQVSSDFKGNRNALTIIDPRHTESTAVIRNNDSFYLRDCTGTYLAIRSGMVVGGRKQTEEPTLFTLKIFALNCINATEVASPKGGAEELLVVGSKVFFEEVREEGERGNYVSVEPAANTPGRWHVNCESLEVTELECFEVINPKNHLDVSVIYADDSVLLKSGTGYFLTVDPRNGAICADQRVPDSYSNFSLAKDIPSKEKKNRKSKRTTKEMLAPSKPFNVQHLSSLDPNFEWQTQDLPPDKLFTLQEELGRGSFGIIYRALHIDGFLLAIKKIELNPNSVADIQNELDILRMCSHPNIVSYFGSFKHEGYLWFLMDYMAFGSIKDIMGSVGGGLEEGELAFVLDSTLNGLNYLHSKGIVHRDVKAANILLGDRAQIKLADFGVSSCFAKITSSEIVGTPLWMAPEVIRRQPASFSSDIWSLGITIIEIVDGVPPNSNETLLKAMRIIVSEEYCPTFTDPASRSPNLLHMLFQCVQRDPNRRPSAYALLSHDFLRLRFDLKTIKHNFIEKLNKIHNTPEASAIKKKVISSDEDDLEDESSLVEYQSPKSKRKFSSFYPKIEDKKKTSKPSSPLSARKKKDFDEGVKKSKTTSEEKKLKAEVKREVTVTSKSPEKVRNDSLSLRKGLSKLRKKQMDSVVVVIEKPLEKRNLGNNVKTTSTKINKSKGGHIFRSKRKITVPQTKNLLRVDTPHDEMSKEGETSPLSLSESVLAGLPPASPTSHALTERLKVNFDNTPLQIVPKSPAGQRRRNKSDPIPPFLQQQIQSHKQNTTTNEGNDPSVSSNSPKVPSKHIEAVKMSTDTRVLEVPMKLSRQAERTEIFGTGKKPEFLRKGQSSEESLGVGDCGVYVVGGNSRGQIGLENVDSVRFPKGLFQFKTATTVACGGHHSLLVSDGLFYSFGADEHGQLGNEEIPRFGDTPSKTQLATPSTAPNLAVFLTNSTNVPTKNLLSPKNPTLPNIPTITSNSNTPSPRHFNSPSPRNPNDHQMIPHGYFSFKKIALVAAGFHHSLVLTDDGYLWSFGSNSFGEVAFPPCAFLSNPQQITFFQNKKIRAMACGNYHSLILTEDGEIFGFGSNSSGQLGNSQEDSSFVPLPIKFLKDKKIVKIASKGNFALAITDEGLLYSFGENQYGQLGLGSPKEVVNCIPKLVTALQHKVIVDVACGTYHCFAITNEGQLFGWGQNKQGQLGLGTTVDHDVPQHIVFFSNKKVLRVACGMQFTVVLTEDYQVFSFGSNSVGQLGLGNFHLQPTPQAIPFFRDRPVFHFDCGSDFAVFLTRPKITLTPLCPAPLRRSRVREPGKEPSISHKPNPPNETDQSTSTSTNPTPPGPAPNSPIKPTKQLSHSSGPEKKTSSRRKEWDVPRLPISLPVPPVYSNAEYSPIRIEKKQTKFASNEENVVIGKKIAEYLDERKSNKMDFEEPTATDYGTTLIDSLSSSRNSDSSEEAELSNKEETIKLPNSDEEEEEDNKEPHPFEKPVDSSSEEEKSDSEETEKRKVYKSRSVKLNTKYRVRVKKHARNRSPSDPGPVIQSVKEQHISTGTIPAQNKFIKGRMKTEIVVPMITKEPPKKASHIHNSPIEAPNEEEIISPRQVEPPISYNNQYLINWRSPESSTISLVKVPNHHSPAPHLKISSHSKGKGKDSLFWLRMKRRAPVKLRSVAKVMSLFVGDLGGNVDNTFIRSLLGDPVDPLSDHQNRNTYLFSFNTPPLDMTFHLTPIEWEHVTITKDLFEKPFSDIFLLDSISATFKFQIEKG